MTHEEIQRALDDINREFYDKGLETEEGWRTVRVLSARGEELFNDLRWKLDRFLLDHGTFAR